MADETDNAPVMDNLDQMWINGFVSETGSIPPGSFIEGFISVISWVDPGGHRQWRHYNTLDLPLSGVLGLLDMAKFTLCSNNQIESDD